MFESNAWQWVCLLAEQERNREHHLHTEINNLTMSPKKSKIQQLRIRYMVVSVMKITTSTKNLC